MYAKGAKQVIDSLECVQYAGIHNDRTVSDCMARAKLLRGRAIKQFRPHAGRNHIHLLFWNSVLDKPLPQLRRYGGNMIGENRSEPVQSACDPVCEPGRADK